MQTNQWARDSDPTRLFPGSFAQCSSVVSSSSTEPSDCSLSFDFFKTSRRFMFVLARCNSRSSRFDPRLQLQHTIHQPFGRAYAYAKRIVNLLRKLERKLLLVISIVLGLIFTGSIVSIILSVHWTSVTSAEQFEEIDVRACVGFKCANSIYRSRTSTRFSARCS